MNEKDYLTNIINFIQEAEKLKNVQRSAFTSSGKSESTAEHSWRLSLLVMLLLDRFEDYDPIRLISLSLIHDLGEIDTGDIPAVVKINESLKLSQERMTINRIASVLPNSKKSHIIFLWNEYNKGKTKEARIIKALDKMETIMQHNIGNNPQGFDYKFNLNYGKDLIKDDLTLRNLRKIVDDMTEKTIADQ